MIKGGHLTGVRTWTGGRRDHPPNGDVFDGDHALEPWVGTMARSKKRAANHRILLTPETEKTAHGLQMQACDKPKEPDGMPDATSIPAPVIHQCSRTRRKSRSAQNNRCTGLSNRISTSAHHCAIRPANKTSRNRHMWSDHETQVCRPHQAHRGPRNQNRFLVPFSQRVLTCGYRPVRSEK